MPAGPGQMERGPLPKGPESMAVVGRPAEQRQDGGVEIGHILGSEVAQFAPLEMGPEVLDRIQHGRVGWQGLEFQPRMGRLEGADRHPPVAGPAVPDQDDRAAEVPQQVPDEVGDGVLVEILVGEGAEVEAEPAAAGGEGEGGDERDFLPVAAAVQEGGRLASRGQGAADQRGQQQPAFVEEDNGGPAAARPF